MASRVMKAKVLKMRRQWPCASPGLILDLLAGQPEVPPTRCTLCQQGRREYAKPRYKCPYHTPTRGIK